MSNIKKLKDEELKQVAGGITIEEFLKHPGGNRPFVYIRKACGSQMTIGSGIRRMVDNVLFNNIGFSNGNEGQMKYTDYFFIQSDNPNITLIIHALDLNNGFFDLSEYD